MKDLSLDLNYVETTGGTNGYPSNIRSMIVADSIDELLQIKNDLEDQGLSVDCYELHKRDGWSLWERCHIGFLEKGHFMPVNDQDWFLDLNMSDSKEVILNEIKEFLFGDEEQFNDLIGEHISDDQTESDVRQKFYEETERFYNDISHHEGNVRVFVDMNEHSVDYVVSDDSASYYYDTHHYQLALEIDEK